jgi:hypothetical protein
MSRLTIQLIVLNFILSTVTFSQSTSTAYVQLQTKLTKGWNTWSYGSMASHVLLPEGLALNINFRQAFIGTPYDPDFFLEKLTVDKTGLVRPIAHTYDGSYTELQIDNWKGNTIRVQSAATGTDIVILITPVKKSSTRFYVELESGILWNRDGNLKRKDERIVASFGERTYDIQGTSPTIKVAHPYTSPYLIFEGDSALAIYTGSNKTLAEVTTTIERAKDTYHQYATKYGDMGEAFKSMQSVLGWNTLYDADKNRVISPVTRGWNEAWHGYVLFEWDTYFAALLFGLDNKDFAYSNAIAITKGQKNNGQVGFIQWPHGTAGTQSQPPVGALTCWMIYEKYKETWFLEEVYDELLSWNQWWIANRTNQGYLTWGAGWKGATLQNIILESGLDNSPMYEDAKVQEVGNNSLLNLADVGLNSLYIADCKYLAKIAAALGKKADEKELLARAKRISGLTAKLWDDKTGIYLNKYLDSNEFSNRLSPTLFYPMLAGVPSTKQAQRMLKEHYYNPIEFYGEYIIPSIARNDKSYDNDYWRGAIWGPMNFLVYMGLRDYDAAAATELANKSYHLYVQAWKEHQYIYENINSEKGIAPDHNRANSDPYYHWGALMGLMKFINDGKY